MNFASILQDFLCRNDGTNTSRKSDKTRLTRTHDYTGFVATRKCEVSWRIRDVAARDCIFEVYGLRGLSWIRANFTPLTVIPAIFRETALRSKPTRFVPRHFLSQATSKVSKCQWLRLPCTSGLKYIVILDIENPIYNLDANCLFNLDSAGLINFIPSGMSIPITNGDKLKYFDEHVIVESEKRFTVGMVGLNYLGRELDAICNPQPVDGFFEYLMGQWIAYHPSVRFYSEYKNTRPDSKNSILIESK